MNGGGAGGGNGIAGYPPSPYLVNLFELQGGITNASGLTAGSVLSNAVSNLQQMVDYEQKRIYVNTVSKFDTSPIQVTDPVNFGSNTVSLRATGGNGIFVSASGTEPAIGFQVAGRTVVSVNEQGQVGIGKTAGVALDVSGAGVFSGTVTASAHLTPSDARLKTAIVPLCGAGEIVDQVRGVTFQWRQDGRPDCGFIAQEVAEVLPAAVTCGADGTLAVSYAALIPYLVETVKDLRVRVAALETLAREKGGATI